MYVCRTGKHINIKIQYMFPLLFWLKPKRFSLLHMSFLLFWLKSSTGFRLLRTMMFVCHPSLQPSLPGPAPQHTTILKGQKSALHLLVLTGTRILSTHFRKDVPAGLGDLLNLFLCRTSFLGLVNLTTSARSSISRRGWVVLVLK